MIPNRVIIFVIGTIGILLLSRRSLNRPDFHGYYRIFAFEGILGLFSLNYPEWFTRPFSPHQILSWILLIASAILAIQGFTLLKTSGKPGVQHDSLPTIGFENTSQLVTTGIYRYIRHPLYSSLIWLAWGIALKQVILLSLILAFISTSLLYRTARVEEIENTLFFGPPYKQYMQTTKMFIPFIF